MGGCRDGKNNLSNLTYIWKVPNICLVGFYLLAGCMVQTRQNKPQHKTELRNKYERLSLEVLMEIRDKCLRSVCSTGPSSGKYENMTERQFGTLKSWVCVFQNLLSSHFDCIISLAYQLFIAAFRLIMSEHF